MFIGVSLVTILPIVLVIAVLAGAVGAVDVMVLRDSSHQNLLDFGVRAIEDLVQILTAMLGAAIASRFYSRFRDQTVLSAA
jgi:hypothetical protein